MIVLKQIENIIYNKGKKNLKKFFYIFSNNSSNFIIIINMDFKSEGLTFYIQFFYLLF